MQIKSRTETKWGDLRQEPEIIFYFLHSAIKTAWHPRDMFEGAPGSQCKAYQKKKKRQKNDTVLDIRIKRSNQN